MARIDRIDFTSSDKCARCNRPLLLGIAHIIIGDDQQERAFGPACARKVDPTPGSIPDFTKGAQYREEDVEEEERDQTGTAATGGNRAATSAAGEAGMPEKRNERVTHIVTYLRLRQELMTDFYHVAYRELQPMYERAMRGNLAPEDIERVGRLMAAVEESRPLLSFKSLQTAYAYHRVLQRAIEAEGPESRRFLASVDSALCRFLYLTPAQIQGVNRWLEKQGNPRLAPCAIWETINKKVEGVKSCVDNAGTMKTPCDRPAPVQPSIDELVRNAAADQQIEGYPLTPEELEKLKVKVQGANGPIAGK